MKLQDLIGKEIAEIEEKDVDHVVLSFKDGTSLSIVSVDSSPPGRLNSVSLDFELNQ